MLTATNRSNIKISKEIELKRFSEKTSKFIKKFKTIFLYGELGVGKTTFVKYLINNLQKHEKTRITEIPSPTFNIVHEYKIKDFKILHYDLYRVKDTNELDNIGIFENNEDSLVLVEWPELIKKKPKNYIKISFKYSKKINERNLRISSHGRCKEYEIN